MENLQSIKDSNGLMGRSYIYMGDLQLLCLITGQLSETKEDCSPRGLGYPHNSQEENGSKQPLNHWFKRFPSLNILKT